MMQQHLAVLACLFAAAVESVRIHEDLLGKAETEGHVDTFVQFKPFDFESGSMARINNFIETRLPEISSYIGLQEYPGEVSTNLTLGQRRRGVRRQIVMDLLKKHADDSQASTLAELEKLGYEVNSYWINNSLMIKRAPVYLLTMLVQLAMEDDNITDLSPNRVVAKIPPVEKFLKLNHAGGGAQKFRAALLRNDPDMLLMDEFSVGGAAPWNLRMLKVEQVWEKTKGAGVVVANIDTGVDFMHANLRDQYRGLDNKLKSFSHEYNWYDPMHLLSFPHDAHGHGTHTIGTIVGRDVGVAPEAKWIAAQGCGIEDCSQERLLASAQWVMCPTDNAGQNPRCDLGADVINNSWGGEITDEESMTWFSPTVQAWRKAGMIPIFAQGNSGPGCATAGTPGDLEDVIGIGAVDINRALTVFSSRGPGGARLGHANFKPDFVAPGQSVISCQRGGGLIAMSGTSMAAPHIAGVAALLLSLKPDMDYEKFYSALKETVNTADLHEPQTGQQACYGKRWDNFPNYHYGHGLVDADGACKILKSL